MTRTRRALAARYVAAALLAVVAALLSGCGSGSGTSSDSQSRMTHAEYGEAIARIELSPTAREADKLFLMLASGSVNGEDCRKGARRFANDVHSIIDSVAALDPPADVGDLQQELLTAARESSSQIDNLARDVEGGTVACGQPWNQRAYGLASTSRAQQIITELGKRGYKLGLNSE